MHGGRVVGPLRGALRLSDVPCTLTVVHPSLLTRVISAFVRTNGDPVGCSDTLGTAGQFRFRIDLPSTVPPPVVHLVIDVTGLFSRKTCCSVVCENETTIAVWRVSWVNWGAAAMAWMQ